MTTTVTIKITDSQRVEFGTWFQLDILADGKHVGTTTVEKFHGEDAYGDIIEEYVHLERIDIDDEHQRKGYGTAAIKALAEKFGALVAAPDNEDARRLYERIGEDAYEVGSTKDEWMLYLDLGYGVYILS
jgi:GNAT superfamily N-acetyltransferase